MRRAREGTGRLHRLWLRDLGEEAHALAWSPDGERLAVAHGSGALTLCDAVRGMPLARARAAHSRAVRALAWSPRSPILVSASSEGLVRLWAANEAEPIAQLDLGDEGAGPLGWSPDGRGLVIASGTRLVVTDDALQVQSVATLPVEGIHALAWRPNSRQLVASGAEGLQIVDAVSGRVLGAFPEDTVLTSIAWTDDGARLAAGGEDGRLFCWDFRASVTGFVDGPGGAVSSIAWSADKERLAAGAEGGWLVWEPSSVDADGGPRHLPAEMLGGVRTLDVSDEGDLVALAGSEGRIECRVMSEIGACLGAGDLAAAPRVLQWGLRAGARQVAVALEEGLVEMLEIARLD